MYYVSGLELTRAHWGILSGGGGSELMDRRGCAILALEVVCKDLILNKNSTQKFILQDFMLAIFQQGKLCLTNISYGRLQKSINYEIL